MEIVESRSLPYHLPPQPPRFCHGNENKGASHLDCFCLDTAGQVSPHFTHADDGCREWLCPLILHWQWAFNSRSSLQGCWRLLLPSIKATGKKCLVSLSEGWLSRQEVAKVGRGETNFSQAREKAELSCISAHPQSTTADLKVAVFAGFYFPIAQSCGLSSSCWEHPAKRRCLRGILSLQTLL